MSLIISLLLFPVSHAMAAPVVEIIDSRTEQFEGRELTAAFRVEKYKIEVQGIAHYGTRMAIQYKTAAVSDLERFAVVQLYRGCQFGSDSQSKYLDVSRMYFGEIATFQARQWQVDSIDKDPIYNSPDEDDLSRHHFYRWSPEADLFSNQNQSYYGLQKPTVPALHVTDRPGQAWYDPSNQKADNISLEFKTCLIRTDLIPRVSTPEKIEFGPWIHCFDWASSFVFDHLEKKMKMPAAIDPFCQVN